MCGILLVDIKRVALEKEVTDEDYTPQLSFERTDINGIVGVRASGAGENMGHR